MSPTTKENDMDKIEKLNMLYDFGVLVRRKYNSLNLSGITAYKYVIMLGNEYFREQFECLVKYDAMMDVPQDVMDICKKYSEIYDGQSEYLAEQIFFEAGLFEENKPTRCVGYRIGHGDDMASTNFVDGRKEQGISCCFVKKDEEIPLTEKEKWILKFSKGFYGDDDVYTVKGWLNTVRKGSDGEPLVIRD